MTERKLKLPYVVVFFIYKIVPILAPFIGFMFFFSPDFFFM